MSIRDVVFLLLTEHLLLLVLWILFILIYGVRLQFDLVLVFVIILLLWMIVLVSHGCFQLLGKLMCFQYFKFLNNKMRTCWVATSKWFNVMKGVSSLITLFDYIFFKTMVLFSDFPVHEHQNKMALSNGNIDTLLKWDYMLIKSVSCSTFLLGWSLLCSCFSDQQATYSIAWS